MPLLSSCRSYPFPLIVPFTRWESEDGSLVFNIQYSMCGGNGYASIDNEKKYFLWESYNYELSCYFPNNEIFATYVVKPVYSGMFWQRLADEAIITGKYIDTPVIGENSIRINKKKFNDERDAKNYVYTRFINEELDLCIYYYLDFNFENWNTVVDGKLVENMNNKLRNVWSKTHENLIFSFLENGKFEMVEDEKITSGNYSTLDDSIRLSFSKNEIFDVDGTVFTLQLEDIA